MNNKDKQLVAEIAKSVVLEVMQIITEEKKNMVSQCNMGNPNYFSYSEFMDAKENGDISDVMDVCKYASGMDSWDTRYGIMFGAELRPLVDDAHQVHINQSCGVAMADDGFVAIKRDGTVEPIAREYPMIIGGCKPCGLYVPFSVSKEGYEMAQEMFSAPFDSLDRED